MALSIKQINAFNLVVLRIAAFLEYLQQVEKLFKTFRNRDNDGKSRLPEKVDAVFGPFVSAVGAVDEAFKLSRASDYSKKIADEDTRRDNLYKSLVSQVKMYMKFDFDKEMQEAAELLWNIIKKYNVNPDENYSEESGKLQQMLQELKRNYQAELRLKKLGLETLVTQLDTANEAVRTMMSQRNDERMYQQKAALATARKEADAAYHDMVAMLNAAALMDDDEARFDELISQVNELIKYYRQYVVPKKSSGSGSDEKDDEVEPTEDGSEDGNSSENHGGQQDGGSSDNSVSNASSGGTGGGEE